MIKYVFILFTLLIYKASQASYIGTRLIDLVERADIISYGKIVAVEKETFKIVILQGVRSCKQHDTLTLKRFEDWACAIRYSEYSIGQEALFFISRKTGWHVLGAANEGELIIKKDTGYVEDYDQHLFAAKKVAFITPYKTYISLPLKTVKDVS